MPAENSIQLENIKTFLEFYIHSEAGGYDVQLEVGCAEDIQYMMELYHKEKYEELFDSDYDRWNFMGAEFQGIGFYNTDENENKIVMKIHGNHKIGSAMLNREHLHDKNAEKIKKIRDIIG